MHQLSGFIEKNSAKMVVAAIAGYALIFSLISIGKYNNFLYNGLDLAIINNVFYNTIHGNWLWSSIQGHIYLGDHFTPILILLLPIYWLYQSPVLLLVGQSIFLGLAAWPIYKISQWILGDNRVALAVSLLWLINPLVHNINLFEFHFISLAPFAILMLFYNYLKLKAGWNKKYLLGWWLWLFLCLMIREDIAWVVLTFLIVAGVSSWDNKKILGLMSQGLVVTVGWLVFALGVIAYFSPSGFSPFAYYYQWIFHSSLLVIIRHVINLYNLEMVIGFLLVFLFIPLLRPRWLALAVIPLLQIILSASGGGAQVWQMHYAALFLPALWLAFIFSYERAEKLTEKYLKSKYLLLGLIVIANLYAGYDLGPFGGKGIQQLGQNKEVASLNLGQIAPSASVLSSFAFLPQLSSRQDIYSLHYYFLGVEQFAQAPYELNKNPDYVVLDKNDFHYYDEILKTSAWAGAYYPQGYDRLDKLLSDYEIIDTSGAVELRAKKN